MNLFAAIEQVVGHGSPDAVVVCSKIQKLRADLIQSSRQFIWQSIIVSSKLILNFILKLIFYLVQPPAVLVKCRVSDSHRSTRFPCRTELRILGGQALVNCFNVTNILNFIHFCQ